MSHATAREFSLPLERIIKASRTLLLLLAALCLALPAPPAPARTPAANATVSSTIGSGNVRHLRFADARLELSFTPPDFQLSEQDVVDWVLRSARATATFFGRFPVSEVHIALAAGPGRGVEEGVAYADPGARIHIVIGRQTTGATLKRDTTLVHEMTHLAFPDLDDTYLWLHEGIATYVENVASAQAGEITPTALWAHFVEEMPEGLPDKGDAGLNGTRSEDRRYVGGAMFCLIADIEIRRRTANRFGLRDALRAILNAGGRLSDTWPVARALAIGDKAVGVPVLSELFAVWEKRAVTPDLERLWRELGVQSVAQRARLVDAAPEAAIRRAITEPPAKPLLLVAPSLLYETQRR